MRAFFRTVAIAFLIWLALMFAAVKCAGAATLGVHTFSWHAEGEFTRSFSDGSSVVMQKNNTNPGLYVISQDGWTAGFYKNSYYRDSVYAGWTWSGPAWRLVRLEATAAFATGYDRLEGVGKLRPIVLPAAVVSLPGQSRARLSGFLAGKGGGFAHLSFERGF